MDILNKWFGKKRETRMGPNDIYFHEDRYLQVEILPRENSVSLDLENRRISGFVGQNEEAPGFSDLYVRGGQSTATIDRRIAVEELEGLLIGMGFSKKDAVYSGYGSLVEKCRNTNAYCLGAAEVFCNFQDGRWVENIWVEGFRDSRDPMHRSRLLGALKSIALTWDLILNDWDLAVKVDLTAEEEIVRYLGTFNSSDP